MKKIKSWSDEKKCIVCLVLTIIFGFLLFYTYAGDTPNEHEGIIRLHVIANSNDMKDQALKLKVRDAVIEYMDDQKNLKNVHETREYLKANLDRLERITDGVIASEGFDYSSNADLGVRYIPEKTYGNITFPAGNYEALNITIGEGEGENWWCVLFPPLCLLEEGSDSINDEKLDDMTKDEAAQSHDVTTTEMEQQLQLRWRLLKFLNKD